VRDEHAEAEAMTRGGTQAHHGRLGHGEGMGYAIVLYLAGRRVQQDVSVWNNAGGPRPAGARTGFTGASAAIRGIGRLCLISRGRSIPNAISAWAGVRGPVMKPGKRGHVAGALNDGEVPDGLRPMAPLEYISMAQ
jgi:hypothetical protein